jgi:hypothetical protein
LDTVGEIQNYGGNDHDREEGDDIGPVENYDQGLGAVDRPGLPSRFPKETHILLKAYNSSSIYESGTLEIRINQRPRVHVDKIGAHNKP